MKTVILLAVLLAATFSLRAETNAMERFSPHLAATTPILWQTGMTNVPNRIWVYRRILPFVFPEAVISNAIVLASLQCKGFPRPTRNEFFIAKEVPANCSARCRLSLISAHPTPLCPIPILTSPLPRPVFQMTMLF